MIPVVWVTFAEDSIARGHWHDEMLGDLFERALWRPVDALDYCHVQNLWPKEGGAVVVVSGAENAEHVADLNRSIARLPWCLVVVAGDESHMFPRDEIEHPNCEVWAMCTRPGDEQRALGFGYAPGTREALRNWRVVSSSRDVAWSFVGQVNHQRRLDMLAATSGVPAGAFVGTDHFAAHLDGHGLIRDDYMGLLTRTKVALCPSGPHTVDSFRLFEALEAGCIPLADAKTPGFDDPGYWSRVFDGQPPFPMLGEWESLPGWLDALLPDATATANCISAWYQQWKRAKVYDVDATVRRLRRAAMPAVIDISDQHRQTTLGESRETDAICICGFKGDGFGPFGQYQAHLNALATEIKAKWEARPVHVTPLADQITVIVTTSPAPLHPSTAHIEETIASIRRQLPDSEIILVADGVRPEQEDRRAAYDEYLARLLWLTNLQWHNVLPVLLPEWGHQANATRAALECVRTPLVLFVEHDTPLCGEIDWQGCASAVRAGAVNVIRFHHEAQVLDVHQYLMLDEKPILVTGDRTHTRRAVPLLRTVQWSQRPHLAPTLWYQEILDRYFAPESRTMIEDVLYGVVENAWNAHGIAGWERWRLALYAPPLPLKRSEHLDSRGDDEKFGMTFAYPGPAPAGAPRPA